MARVAWSARQDAVGGVGLAVAVRANTDPAILVGMSNPMITELVSARQIVLRASQSAPYCRAL